MQQPSLKAWFNPNGSSACDHKPNCVQTSGEEQWCASGTETLTTCASWATIENTFRLASHSVNASKWGQNSKASAKTERKCLAGCCHPNSFHSTFNHLQIALPCGQNQSSHKLEERDSCCHRLARCQRCGLLTLSVEPCAKPCEDESEITNARQWQWQSMTWEQTSEQIGKSEQCNSRSRSQNLVSFHPCCLCNSVPVYSRQPLMC